MDKNMELLLQKLDEKLDRQAEQITQSVTRNVMEGIDDKMNKLMEENKYLKNKMSELESKINLLESEKRKNNLVFFGVEEEGKSETELVDYIKETIEGTGVHINSQEINKVYRIGRKTENRNRPVVASFTTIWKKHLILKNKPNLPPNIYVKEDYSKETLEIRKQLQPQVEEEKKKGNIAYIKKDKLIVIKPKDNSREKRKRETSGSPGQSNQKKASTNNVLKNTTQPPSKNHRSEIIRPNILDYIEKTRSDPQPNSPKN
ncbi:hypothetical protein MSG28_014051 [Choristoneura fumiferana]|uniref:Uncharacterized protein n=1 Tax=Choristoneura fumiferana TaxID=7141 RepID=A0ACC0JFN4_CHOFU|nr:hypothetical protein MSG28_014051 [Choristoneura fumiferana]